MIDNTVYCKTGCYNPVDEIFPEEGLCELCLAEEWEREKYLENRDYERSV